MTAKKKDFANTDVSPVYDTIDLATQTDPENHAEDQAEKPVRARKSDYDAAERLEAMSNLKTGGRKGMKLQRINMAFTPDNYEYIQVMARVRGQNLTQFVNDVISLSKENNAALFEQAVRFRKGLK